MRGAIYKIAVLTGLLLFVWIYLFNFDNFSESELVQVVLYWYIPFIFGIYGLVALRIRKYYDDSSPSVIKHLFSGNDPMMLPLMILLFVLGGIIGIFLFFLPITIFKIKKEDFDLKVSISATVLFLVLLWVFFIALWPSL